MFQGYGEDKSEFFESQTNGIISDSIVQNWTMQALECYKINCNCDICQITKAHYSFKCKMKDIVNILLKSLGEPDEQMILNNGNIVENDNVA